MNKFELINVVTLSDLRQENKPLLTELIMRSDDDGLSWPSVERLCKARGIKHEKNFKGADVYLPGLVTKIKNSKNARKNAYIINVPAILDLAPAEVVIKHTDYPALADNYPAVEGANSSKNNTVDNSENNTRARFASSSTPNYKSLDALDDLEDIEGVGSSTEQDYPATAGVLSGPDEW